MTWLNAKGGSLIVRNGALAVGEGCCCTPLPGDCTPCTLADGSTGVIVGGECMAGVNCRCGLPRRSVGGPGFDEITQFFWNGQWYDLEVYDSEGNVIGGYGISNNQNEWVWGTGGEGWEYDFCIPVACDVFSYTQVVAGDGGVLPPWVYNAGGGLRRVSCSSTPIGTICDPYGGPMAAYGIPDDPSEASLLMQPGETCVQYSYCDPYSGDCAMYGYLRDSQAGADMVADCSECVPWYVCTTNGAQLLGYGKSASLFANSFDELQRPLYEGMPIVSSGNECSYLCHPENGCIPSHDGLIASCASCVQFCDPASDCAFVGYGVTAADLGNENLVPCDECNPLP